MQKAITLWKDAMRQSWTRISVGLLLAVVMYAGVMYYFSSNAYYMQILTLACINVILAVSLNLINGFTGQFSIGHAGFMGVGAYMAAFMTKELGLPFLVALAGGFLFSAFIGFLVGAPTLRLRGDYLAIATLGFGEIIRVVITNMDRIGGPRGYGGVPPVTNFAWAFAFAVFTVVVIKHFIDSTHGRACLSIREDEIAAEAMGINTTRYKVLAFSLGAGFAGLSGGLFAHLLTFLHPTSFNFLKSVDYLVMVVVGGWGSLTGPIGAAVGLTILNELLRRFADLRMVIYSLILITTMLLRPQGILGGKEFSIEGVMGLWRRFVLPILKKRRRTQDGAA